MSASSLNRDVAATWPFNAWVAGQPTASGNHVCGSAVPRLTKNKLSHSTFPAKTPAPALPVAASLRCCGTRLRLTPSARPLPFSTAQRNEPENWRGGGGIRARSTARCLKRLRTFIVAGQPVPARVETKKTCRKASAHTHCMTEHARGVVPRKNNEERAGGQLESASGNSDQNNTERQLNCPGQRGSYPLRSAGNTMREASSVSTWQNPSPPPWSSRRIKRT